MKQYNPHDKTQNVQVWLTEGEFTDLMDFVNDRKREGQVSRGHIIRSAIVHSLKDPKFKLIKEYSGAFAEVDKAIDNLGEGKVFEYDTYQPAKSCEKHIRNKYPQLFVSLKKARSKAFKTRDALKTEAIYKVIVMERK